jgi:hypothetical protein
MAGNRRAGNHRERAGMAIDLRRACAWLLLIGWIVAEQHWVWAQPGGDGRPAAAPRVGQGAVPPKRPASSLGQLNGIAPSPPLTPLDNTRNGFGGFGGNGAFGGFSGFGFTGIPNVQRFPVEIKPDTPLEQLLPVATAVPRPPAPWLVNDLARVPEVFFQKPFAITAPLLNDADLKTGAEKAKRQQEIAAAHQAAQQQATVQIAHTLGKINHVNKSGKDPDRFIHVLTQHRTDLAGLPFVTGDACRMSKGVARQFVQEVAQLRVGFGGGFGVGGGFGGGAGFSGGIGQPPGAQCATPLPAPPPTADETARAKVAALMQILGPQPAARQKELVKTLAGIDYPAATQALARLAVFSVEKETHGLALAVLKKRPAGDAAGVLRDGLRYPWPAMAQNAAEAVAALQRFDLASALVDMMEQPDPRAPATSAGRAVPVVREVVRLNHHHNCMTCHPPATSDADFDKNGFTTDFVTGPVSSADVPLASFGYFGSGSLSPDIFVRADVTYLRQDFSLMQRVPNADPNRPVQRFDFLIRTREVTAAEADSYRVWLNKQGPGYRSPYQAAAHAALRRLTGRNVAPIAAAWRQELAFVGPRMR